MKLLVGCLCLSGLLMPVAAQLQDRIEVTVPFDFQVGSTRLSAGTYIIGHPSTSGPQLKFTSVETTTTGPRSIVTLITPAVALASHREAPVVLFNKYKNGRYYVASVWTMDTGVRFPMSADERVTSRLIASAKPDVVLVAARLRH